jgi:hypothetical protein
VSGDQFGLTNVVTKLPVPQMMAGYRRVLETLYHPEVFFQRCRENIARWTPPKGAVRPMSLRDLPAGLRAVWGQGVTGRYRKAYWQFLEWVLRHHPDKIRRALAQAAAGHHYISYTRNTVVPALLRHAPAVTGPEPALAI